MKLKKKVYPSPSPSPFPSPSSAGDHLSVLKFLPAAILALASVLSLEDREVLAYLITTSLKTTTTTTNDPSSILQDAKRKSSKKPLTVGSATGNTKGNSRHKPPVFDCDCFECYTSYWLRWDSSPNRELIHQVIEAFEDHLSNGETQKSKSTRNRKGRRSTDNPPLELPPEPEPIMTGSAISSPEQPSPPRVIDEPLPEKETEEQASEVADMTSEFDVSADDEVAVLPTAAAAAAASNHKGLARKVLPDVLGIFNSRLWNLWSPNV
ncbi:hypothetical protein SLEP1_g6487 [Rubroshorea leprosula]|uniref:Uncharacterized protein n=1 Tax=Rubroshorea leprosula TaxID=152421 RepID=A0AAV5HVD8_9ROSI|nr:hypothetical protein SLEP1_g6487 [Rubroshorea leprosula]